MTDIPDDIMESAKSVETQVLKNMLHGPCAEFIARSILAERERCAEIAKAGSFKTRKCFMICHSAEAIAHAIMVPSCP